MMRDMVIRKFKLSLEGGEEVMYLQLIQYMGASGAVLVESMF